jgi:hypothetical protein
MPTRTEARTGVRRAPVYRGPVFRAFVLTWPVLALAGCDGEPSKREVNNARAFEALLTAVSLKNKTELERDAKIIDERHAASELSDAKYKDLQGVIEKARTGNWDAAEKQAYEFREQFGDRGSFFK